MFSQGYHNLPVQVNAQLAENLHHRVVVVI